MAEPAPPIHVLIIGAGVVGLTLAQGLKKVRLAVRGEGGEGAGAYSVRMASLSPSSSATRMLQPAGRDGA